MRMGSTKRFPAVTAAAILVGGLSLAACGDDDEGRSEFIDEMERVGASNDQANCVADRVEDETGLDEDTMSEVGISEMTEWFEDCDIDPTELSP